MPRARRTALMRDSGPYAVESRSNGTLIVRPRWSQFPEWNHHDGGGPGFMSRMALAHDLQSFLNGQPPEVGERDA